MIMQEIVILRGIGIILVVLGHSDIVGQNTPATFLYLESMVYKFHMPLFMFISGFVFYLTNHQKSVNLSTEFIWKKLYRLILPALVVLTLAFSARFISLYIKRADLGPQLIINFVKMPLYKEYLPIEFFWFIFTLFYIFCISNILLYCVKQNTMLIVISITLIIFCLWPVSVEFLYIRYISNYLIYFWLGMLSCLGISRIPFVGSVSMGSLYVATFFLAGFLTLSFLNLPTQIAAILYAILGIFMCLYLAIYLKRFRINILNVIGQYSYQIFLISWFFHRIIETIGYKTFGLNYFITFPLSLCLALLGPIFITKLIGWKSPKLAFLIGQQKNVI